MEREFPKDNGWIRKESRAECWGSQHHSDVFEFVVANF